MLLQNLKLAIIGLGYVGFPPAVEFGKTCSAIGFDVNQKRIDELKAAGSKWNFLTFWPGLVGGYCIGVDSYYLTHKAQAIGYNP